MRTEADSYVVAHLVGVHHNYLEMLFETTLIAINTVPPMGVNVEQRFRAQPM